MRHLNWQRNPDLLAVMNVLAAASLLGFLYCVYALLFDLTLLPASSLVLYSIWFLVSIVSLYLMKHDDVWGAYAISLATLLIGIYEITHGTATIGGAILAAWVLFLALYYLYQSSTAEDENERIPTHS